MHVEKKWLIRIIGGIVIAAMLGIIIEKILLIFVTGTLAEVITNIPLALVLISLLLNLNKWNKESDNMLNNN